MRGNFGLMHSVQQLVRCHRDLTMTIRLRLISTMARTVPEYHEVFFV
jgi:hypothetical protein